MTAAFWRRLVRPRVVVSAAAIVIVAMAVPVLTRMGTPPAYATSTTVTGTFGGDNAYDPATGGKMLQPPSVTVEQVDDLTEQTVRVTWKNFTPSVNGSGQPTRSYVPGNTFYTVSLVECRNAAPQDPAIMQPLIAVADTADCYGFTAQSATADHGPGNMVTALTGADGTGEALFHIETKVENDYLGCDSTHPCSLVVVPNWGGVQRVRGKLGSPQVNCADHSADIKLVLGAGQWAKDANNGLACSWNDRFVVPLTFAPTPQSCPAKDPEFAADGAPMLARTVSQWQAGWCNGQSALTFDYDSGINEYQARQSFLSGLSDVAVVNQPVDPVSAGDHKFTYAPIATSGIAIAYHIDDQQTGKLITDLTLNARLVAKLLTESYTLRFDCTSPGIDPTQQGPNCDPGVRGNPHDIFQDPEFLALNPQYSAAEFPTVSDFSQGEFLPLVVAGNSDLVHELTRWVASDPDAAAFLNGQADPWGMHVNSYYRAPGYPVDLFQVLDPGYTAPPSDNGTPGQSTMQVAWSPVTGLANVVNSLVVDQPSGQTTTPSCPPPGTPGPLCTFPRISPVNPGHRGLFAVVDLNDAAIERFPTAKLVNAGGQAVGPTATGLAAAVNDMQTNPDKITQYANFDSPDPKQYPLTMVDYAMLPTCEVPAAKVEVLDSFLDHVAASQVYGIEPGLLTPGGQALTKAQLSQVAAARQAITSQSCNAAPADQTIGGKPAQDNTEPPPPPASTSGAGGTSGGGSTPVGASATPAGGSTPMPSHSSSASPGPSARPVAYGVKHADSAGALGAVLPALLITAGVLVAGGPATYLLTTTGAGMAAVRRVRGWLRI